MEEELRTDEQQASFASYIEDALNMPSVDIKTYSPLTLAYIGDAIFDLIIKTMVVKQGNAPVNAMHKLSSEIVNASAQAAMYFNIKDKLSESEILIFKRGRNAKPVNGAKNATVSEYRIATGLEALFGYLYLTNQVDRVLELVNLSLKNNTPFK